MNGIAYAKYARWSRMVLVVINILAVFLVSLTYLFASKYIVETGQSHALMEALPSQPLPAVSSYWITMVAFSSLLIILYCREHLDQAEKELLLGLAIAEVILTMIIFFATRFAYNGLILLVFSDIFYAQSDFYDLKQQRYWLTFITGSFALLLVTNSDLLSLIITIPSLDTYLDFLPATTRFELLFLKNFLTIGNMVVFIVSLVIFIMFSVSENHKIEEELRMAARANTELEGYIGLSEKMAEDRERKRIAREIHDTLGHALTGISAGIDAVQVLIDVDTKVAKRQLQGISGVVREGIQDVRRSLEKLRPGALEQGGLKEALLKMIEDYEILSKLQVELDYEWDQVDLDIAKEDIVFRVIQETITNSLRHGHADHVWIRMTKEDKHYAITISDDGIGCEQIQFGYGLTQMQERLGIIGGQVTFSGENGFETRVKIPKRRGEEDD
ncbi:TPA: sensor histidine kinase [Streptococcus suis]|nr:sensor histidine kinase [Streptococcus suis]